MVDKHEFLDRLRTALTERDVAEKDIEPYIERFDRFYDRMVSDPSQDRLLNDIDRIADNIAEQISERYDEMNRLAERTLTVDRVKEDAAEEPSQNPPPEKTEAVIPTGETAQPQTAASSLEPAPDSVPREENEEPVAPPQTDYPEYIDEEPSPNSRMFWILFAVSLPVTVPLALCLLALFVAGWAALAVLLVGAIGALIGVVAGGTALALVGVVYGITKLFSVLPVGLYEIGLGVMVGSAVMFFGILLYNFAIRLVPWLMRLIGRLFMYTWGRAVALFRFLRKECAKL